MCYVVNKFLSMHVSDIFESLPSNFSPVLQEEIHDETDQHVEIHDK